MISSEQEQVLDHQRLLAYAESSIEEDEVYRNWPKELKGGLC